MRLLATGLLALMTAVFLAARAAPAAWGWPPYVQAFAEAGMVGACADWFAVTALFRRPLGLPIPHTGIIPRNKDRIGEALGDFLTNNFLTPAVLDERLRRLQLAGRLAGWLGEPGRAEALAARLAGMAPDLMGPGAELRDLAGDLLRQTVEARPIAPLASRMLAWLWREPAVQRLVGQVIDGLARFGHEREGYIQSRLSGEAWKWMPKWLDRFLAEKFTRDLLRAADEIRDPEHPWRRELDAAVEDLIRRLAEDPEVIARGEAVKARLLADPDLGRGLAGLWSDLSERLAADPQGRAALWSDALTRALKGLAGWLSEDPRARERLDRWIRVAARRTLSAQRQAIGGFVAQVVAGWDAADVSARLELQVGRDLQYIRINGTLVGGLVGLAIYALARALA